MVHALMENRHALVANVRLTAATGLAERAAVASMVEAIPGRHRITVGGDKANDPKDFVANLRSLWAGLRKTRHRGTARVGWMFTLTAAAYNLIRLPKLLAAA